MMTRMVLVGLVAALGLSIPTWPEAKEWMKAAHSWTAHRLVEWDRGSRRRLEPVILPLPPRRAQRFEPIVVADGPISPADELNRAAEFACPDPRLASVERRRIDRPAEASRVPAAEGGEIAAIGMMGTPEWRGIVELWRSSRPVAVDPGRPDSALVVRPATTGHSRADCVFAASQRSAPPAPPTLAMRRTARPSFEPIETVATPGTDVAAELNRIAEGLDLEAPGRIRLVAAGRRFDPIEPARPGPGEELNRVFDGLSPSPAAGPAAHRAARASAVAADDDARARVLPEPTTAMGPSPEVSQAVRLTGQAFHAWMRVMTAPAGVRLSVR